MAFWDGNRWIREGDAPPVARPSRITNWSATVVMIVGLSFVVLPLATMEARSAHSDPACSLAAINLGNTDVVQITATGLPNMANFVIDWVEPQITQTEYYGSTNHGVLQDTVLNDQGPGTFSASVWWRSNKGDVWEASCSLTVS